MRNLPNGEHLLSVSTPRGEIRRARGMIAALADVDEG